MVTSLPPPDAPWQFLSVMFQGDLPKTLKAPRGFTADPDLGNKVRTATDTFIVERYFDNDIHLDEPISKLCAWVTRAVRQHDLEVLGFMIFARVTSNAPGFGFTLSPDVLAALSAFGVMVDVSVYVE